MKKTFNIYTMRGATEKDDSILLAQIEKKIDFYIDDMDLYIDENNKVYNGRDEYVADGTVVGPGNGIGFNL